MKYTVLLLLLGVTLFISCTSGTKQTAALSPLRIDTLRYAKGFTIEEYNDYTRITVLNPWEGNRVYARYDLCRDSTVQTPPDGTRIIIPITRIALGSNTQFAFVELLGTMNSVVGVCDTARIFSPTVLSKVRSGETVDLGDSFQMNHERLLMLRPQAVMMSGHGTVDEYSRRVSQIGINVVFNNEWMETDLLARAEWIKFVARFFDAAELGDSLFAGMEARYLAVKQQLPSDIHRPSILSGDNFRGTWYMPGGHSFMGNLYKEAGADYAFAADTTRGSLPVDYESVLMQFSRAEVWIGADAVSLEQLGRNNERNKLFDAYKTGRVYNSYNRVTPSGGNDFWESGVARPDLLLADFVKALHPDLLPDHELYYLKQLR